MVVTTENKNKENSDQFNCFQNNKMKQAESGLLPLNIEKKISHTAHEIRNPLCAMELHSRIISKKLESINEDSIDSIKSSINCILNSIEVLKSITDGLKSQNTELDIQEINISQITKKAAQIIAPVFEEKNININIQCNGDIFCQCDEKKTFQIIYNLMKNALEATASGGTVKIYLKEEAQQIRLFIEDTGCGIPQINIDKIFNPKFTTKQTGCGIGLCESRKIAKAQGGEIRLASTSPKGSIFEIILPR